MSELTAELTITTARLGNRRLTAGAFRQLDKVPPGDLDPVARVRLPTLNADAVHVIGTRKGSGEAVASYAFAVDRAHARFPFRSPEHISPDHHAAFAALPLVIL